MNSSKSENNNFTVLFKVHVMQFADKNCANEIAYCASKEHIHYWQKQKGGL